jgi:hypothetical protein
MPLKQFLDEKGISIIQASYDIRCCYKKLCGIVSKKIIPSKKIAERIVKYSNDLVTLADLWDICDVKKDFLSLKQYIYINHLTFEQFGNMVGVCGRYIESISNKRKIPSLNLARTISNQTFGIVTIAGLMNLSEENK